MIGWIDNQLAAAIAELAKEPPVGHLYANGIGLPTVKGTVGATFLGKKMSCSTGQLSR